MPKPGIKYSTNDNYESPKEAFEIVFKYISPIGKKIWCPFYCEGLLTQHLTELGIDFYHEKRDFFTYEPENGWDYIIDNPPFSKKREIMERCIALGKPFALLMPEYTAFDYSFMRDIQGMQLIIPKPRLKCIKPNQPASNPTSKICWFCFGFNILDGRQLIYD